MGKTVEGYDEAPDDDLDEFITQFERAERNYDTVAEAYKDLKGQAVDRVGEGKAFRNRAGTFAIQITQPKKKLVLHEPSAKQACKQKGLDYDDFVDLLATIRDIPAEAYKEIEPILQAHGVDTDTQVHYERRVRVEELKEVVGLGAFKEEKKSRPAVRTHRLGGGD